MDIDVSFGDRLLINIWCTSTHWHLGSGGGEQHGNRHHNATQMVNVVRGLKMASCEDSCHIYCSLAKLAYIDNEVDSQPVYCTLLLFKMLIKSIIQKSTENNKFLIYCSISCTLHHCIRNYYFSTMALMNNKMSQNHHPYTSKAWQTVF